MDIRYILRNSYKVFLFLSEVTRLALKAIDVEEEEYLSTKVQETMDNIQKEERTTRRVRRRKL